MSYLLVFLWWSMLMWALVGALDINIIPRVQRLTVGVGMTQTISCYVTAHDTHAKPEWYVPANATYTVVNKTERGPEGNIALISTIIFQNFREENEGNYTCLCQDPANNTTIEIVAGCPYEKFGNGKNCTECSRHCLAPADPQISPCDLTNGTCVKGCMNGYTGHMCSIPESSVPPRITNSGTSIEQDEKEDTTVNLRDTKTIDVYQKEKNDESLQQETPVSTTSIRPYDHQTRETTAVPRSRARSSTSQPPPHEYIILGIFVLFTIGAITFCVYKLRNVLWKCFCIPIQNMASRNSSKHNEHIELHYVNVDTSSHPASSPNTEQDGPEEPLYASVHDYEMVV